MFSIIGKNLLRPPGAPEHSRILLLLALAVLLTNSLLAAGQGTMQIIAHQDDDILFMNPDLFNSVSLGYRTTTVYVTAGEAQGAPGMTREQFAGSRQLGAQAAYASMLGVANSWQNTLCTFDGIYAEVDQLIAAPQVTLVFLNLPDGGDGYDANTADPWRTYALAHLYFRSNPYPPYPLYTYTIVPTNWPASPCIWPAAALGTPPPTSYYYNRNILTTVLVDLLKLVHPDVVRTLDPAPYELCSDPSCSNYLVSFDNLDHQCVARFVREVLPQYGKHRATMNYIGYSIADYQGNLSVGDYISKESIVDTYGQFDPNYLAYRDGYLPWFGAEYERYPANTNWLQRLPDGKLAAFGTRNDRLVMWRERQPGGSWMGPVQVGTLIADGAVAPSIGVSAHADGHLQLFYLRAPRKVGSAVPQICTLEQLPGLDSFGPITCLGSPARVNSDWNFVPVGAIGADDSAWVFARNDVGGVSANHQVGGVWSGWADLPGDPSVLNVIDGIVAIQGYDGRLEVFASSRYGVIQQWYQSGPNGAWNLVSPFPANAPVYLTNSLGVGRNANGDLEVFFRDSGYSHVLSVRELWPGGDWSQPNMLYGDLGHGPVSVIRHPSGELAIFELNTWGGVSETSEFSPNGQFNVDLWQVLDGNLIYFPSGAIDAAGRGVVGGFGIDGKLYIRRQLYAGASSPWGNWTLVGP